MVSTEVAVPLIQLVALFLPAWAVVMQVFTRIIKETNLQENPTLVPFFSLGFILAFASLYWFGLTGFNIMMFFVKEGITRESGLLARALFNVSGGSIAFVGLGTLVIMVAGFRHISPPELYYVGAGSFAFGVVLAFAWSIQSVLLIFGGVAVIMILMWIGLYPYGYPKPSPE